jgi:hypothetical protein
MILYHIYVDCGFSLGFFALINIRIHAIICTGTNIYLLHMLSPDRVILRSPYVGNQFISQSQYKQMIGRAGRSGFCQRGESILMFKDCDKEKVHKQNISDDTLVHVCVIFGVKTYNPAISICVRL